MKITVLCVGKIKEKYWNDAIAEYSKRLSRYCTLNIVEVPDEKTPENAPEAVELQIKKKEGDRILEKLSGFGGGNDVCSVALAIDGKSFDSVKFSEYIEDMGLRGKSHIVFIIGGSLGLSEEVLAAVNAKISFSAMTFPHQMMRVILLEQIYRGYRIARNEPYHK